MSEQESRFIPTAVNVKFSDPSHLSIQHVNAMAVNAGSDEFFIMLGVVVPPDQEEMKATKETGYVVAQPVYRFAMSRDSMEKFLSLLAGQYDQQTSVMKELQRQRVSTSAEEGSREELLSDPLFQVAGIFEIDEPGWAERHEELLGEAYR